MKGDAGVIEALNQVLTGELTAINQYFLHAMMNKDWGYLKLASKMREESIEEMRHAEEVAERILFLDGVPNFQKMDKINIGETVPEQLESDLELEHLAIARLKVAIENAYKAHDHASRELFEKILKEEEDHIDWIEAQLGLIKDIGLENYLAQQL